MGFLFNMDYVRNTYSCGSMTQPWGISHKNTTPWPPRPPRSEEFLEDKSMAVAAAACQALGKLGAAPWAMVTFPPVNRQWAHALRVQPSASHTIRLSYVQNLKVCSERLESGLFGLICCHRWKAKDANAPYSKPCTGM